VKKINHVVREADATVRESRETGVPIDEVFDKRAERNAEQVAASQPVVEDYNEAAMRLRERGTDEDRLAVWAAMEDLNHLGSRRRIDRRSLLKGAGLAALALGGSTILQPARAVAATSAPRVAIIGGGLAGLRTAHKLWIDRGIKSTIYEANAEIGGRCHTNRDFFLDNQIVEAHGELVNSEHYAVKALAARYGLGMDDLSANYPQGIEDTFWINGARYTEWEVTQDWKAFGYNAFHDAVLQAEAPQTYDNYNAQAAIWDKMNVPTFVNSLPGMKGTRLAKLASESAQGEWGPPGDVSGLGMLWQWAYNSSKKTAHSYQSKSYLWSEGGDARWHVQGGSDGLVTGMVGELPAGTIKTQSPVLAIVKNANGTYNLSVKTGNKTSQVTVDHVVIAAPFTSLRANVNLTKAGISPLKMTAIKNLGMTTQGKIFLQFNGHPWYQYNSSYVLVDSPVNWWYEANYQTNNNTSPKAIQEHFTIDGVTERFASQYGMTAHEGTAPAAAVNELLPGLDTYYGPGVSAAYNGKAWYHFGYNDPWVKGAWPYWKPGQVTGFSGIEGVREGNIHFAGDATEWDFIGFMEGALLSGERCAAEI